MPEPLKFVIPSPIHSPNLDAELKVAGFDVTHAIVGDELHVAPAEEEDRAAIQAVLEAHTGELTEEQTRPLLVQQKIDAAITQMRDELANFPADLAAGATLAQVRDRTNLIAGQEKRNTERILKLAQLARGAYDQPES